MMCMDMHTTMCKSRSEDDCVKLFMGGFEHPLLLSLSLRARIAGLHHKPSLVYVALGLNT